MCNINVPGLLISKIHGMQQRSAITDQCPIDSMAFGLFRTEKGYLTILGRVVEKILTKNIFNVKFESPTDINEYRVPDFVKFDNQEFASVVQRQSAQSTIDGSLRPGITDMNLVFVLASDDDTIIEKAFIMLVSEAKEKIRLTINEELDKNKQTVHNLTERQLELKRFLLAIK